MLVKILVNYYDIYILCVNKKLLVMHGNNLIPKPADLSEDSEISKELVMD